MTRARLVITVQPCQQAPLVLPALLAQERRQFLRGHGLRRCDLRRPRRQVGVEQVGRRGGLYSARLLHLLVFGKQLERHRTRAADQLVEEYAQLAARAVDQVAGRLDLAWGHFLETLQLALELVGIRGDRVESDHLDRAGGLVDVRARVLERRRVLGRRLEGGERLEAARERLVDFTLHPGQGAEVEFRCGVVGHGGGRCQLGVDMIRATPCKNRACPMAAGRVMPTP